MIRNILAIFLFFLFLQPQTVFTKENDPKIYFPETFRNFGETLQGTVLKHSFVFENRGKSTLIIEDIKSG